LPSSMSGLPALRCFIFFAADLFILVLSSFVKKPPEEMGQGFTLIYTALNSRGWTNSSLNHGNITGLHQH
jgi:hypothetical protein